MSKFELDIDYKNLDETNFEEIANQLLNESYLKINGIKYRLVEIEFYLRNKAHPDMYVHANEEQLLNNKYYFHRFANGTYKGGTFKGMDIVFGNEKTYFGILIRAIQNIKKDIIIEGPCNVVNHILKAYDYESVLDFTNNKSISLLKNKHDFVLKSTENLDYENLYAGPRIGLTEGKKYWANPYRYCIFQNRIKKQKTKLILLKTNSSSETDSDS